jgi:hypothetical protein
MNMRVALLAVLLLVGRVARTINCETNLGAQHVGFTCGALDFAFFLLASMLSLSIQTT